ncbi:hypothetical protein [Alteromonas gilva]|uniref:Acetyltransferase n=1 Tax=Alteromonas gilva TaxID=2987522 RepID=A0ABT5L7A5_9ALTE|nr:hypothetical protein [Alteromonas gilva]MDC8831697.1 hypothetical protein [Alteromonas gilva]
MAFFEPARQLYLKHGFEFCGPFADYPEDPNSCFMHQALHTTASQIRLCGQ